MLSKRQGEMNAMCNNMSVHPYCWLISPQKLNHAIKNFFVKFNKTGMTRLEMKIRSFKNVTKKNTIFSYFGGGRRAMIIVSCSFEKKLYESL